MKYLIQNRKEFAISAGFFIMTAINLVQAIKSQNVTQDVVVALIYAFFGVMAWFYNMPTSEENCKYTGLMRLKKAKRKGRIDGEDFFDEAEEGDEE